jgi:FkbM family methyltransferase
MKQLLRNFLNKCGIEVRLVKKLQAQLRDAFIEQQRLLGKDSRIVVFDVGAYDGCTANRYKKYFPNAVVYSFEPFRNSFQMLAENAKKNSYINAVNAAVSDKVGTSKFFVNSFDKTNSLLSSEITDSYLDELTKSVDEVEVNTITIDHFCNENKIDFIDVLKIDVQGNGLPVLKGAEKMFADKKIKMVYIEIEFIQIYKGQSLMFELTEYLDKFNYKLFGLYNLSHQKSGQLAWGDAIYYSEDLEPTIRLMNA